MSDIPEDLRNEFQAWCLKNPATNAIELALKLAQSAEWWLSKCIPKSTLRKFIEERMKLLAMVENADDALKSIKTHTYGHAGPTHAADAMALGQVEELDLLRKKLLEEPS